jgi:hypothetical protein
MLLRVSYPRITETSMPPAPAHLQRRMGNDRVNEVVAVTPTGMSGVW